MKRIAFAVLALSLGGALAFGQTAPAAPAPQGQFHAWNQGEFIPVSVANNGSPRAGWGPAWDTAAGLDQEWTFSYDGKNFGFDGTLEFGGDNIGNSLTGASALSWFGTYYKFGDAANPYAKLYAGKPRVGDWDFASYIGGNRADGRIVDSNWAAFLTVYPVAGLTLEATDFVPNANVPNSNSLNPADNFSAGAKYSITDTATVLAYYKAVQSNASGQTQDAESTLNVVSKKYFDVGLQYNTIKNVGLQAELAYDTTVIGTGTGTNGNAGGLSGASSLVSLYAGATTSLVDNVALSLDFFLKAYSSISVFALEANGLYTFPKTAWSVGGNVGYDNGANEFNGSNETELTGMAGAGFLVQPYVQYSADGGSGTINLGFLYVTGGVNNALTGNVATTPAWAIPVTYVWSF